MRENSEKKITSREVLRVEQKSEHLGKGMNTTTL